MFVLAGKGCVAVIKEPLVNSLYGAFHCSERGGLFLAGRPRPRTAGRSPGPEWQACVEPPVSRLPGREVVSAGGELAAVLQCVGVSTFSKCLKKQKKVWKIPENEASDGGDGC